MKKIFLALMAAVTLAQSYGQTQAKEEPSSNAAQVTAEETENFARIDRVLSKMSARAQKEIKITDKKAFLQDLKKVLDEEKTFKKDDISLYHLIDKKHNIGEKYVPTGLVKLVKNDLYRISRNDLSLRPDVEKALQTMAAAYKKQTGDTLLVISTYRSYNYQKNLFKKWVAIDGLAEAERESAREGTSQHQLGSAIDFCELTNNFVNKPMGKWLNTHSEEYGWSLSFPQKYEDITGYRWECWHFRYIGIPACQLQKKYFLDVQQYMLEFIDFWKQELKK